MLMCHGINFIAVDLVTLDNLSAEAMLESSQRVENLVDHFKQRQELMSDPGPPSIAPAKTKKASFGVQVVALWMLVFSAIHSNI